jgi:GNAT superfamily N-acetyltransferase
MVASPGDPPQVSSARVALVEQVREHDIGRRPLIGRDNVLLAEATEQGHYAGRAWLHLDHDSAGIYDMEIWPPFRRQGLGRELLTLLVTEGKRRGARTIMGETLYLLRIHTSRRGADMVETFSWRDLEAITSARLKVARRRLPLLLVAGPQPRRSPSIPQRALESPLKWPCPSSRSISLKSFPGRAA